MRWFQAAVVLVATAHFINLLPSSRLFEKFAFGDNGWPLVADSLLDQGLKPVTDFGYFYGLLTLTLDRVLFAIFGRTPDVTVWLYFACSTAVAVGMARLVKSAKMWCLPALFLVTTVPLSTIPRGFPSPAHAMEAALLMTAIAEHAAGRLNRSLLSTVLAVFFKPSLGYVYGLLLVVLILREPDRWKKLLPAAITGLGVTLLLSLQFGLEPVLRTQIPLDGMRAYKNENFGFFFGTGRSFWDPKDGDFDYYFGGVPGPWLICSSVLLLAAFALARRWREPVAGMVVACAILHGTFVVLLFGNQFTWIYYTYILFAGCAVGVNFLPKWLGGLVALGLATACVAGQSMWLWGGDLRTGRMTANTPESANLAVPRQIWMEWKEVRAIAAAAGPPEKTLVFTRMGGPQFLAPELDGPHWWCVIEGFTSESELERARAQLRAAEWLVSPDWHDNTLMKWAAFQADLAAFEPFPATFLEEDGSRAPFKSLKVFRRKK